MKYRDPHSLRFLASGVLLALLAIGTAHLLHGSPARSEASPASQQTPPAQRTPGAGPVAPSDRQRPTPQTIQSDELAKELSSNSKPTIVCVGPRVLYEGAHVPGAVFHGAASTGDGLNDLRQWAQNQPRDANIVLYCGCCPFTQCPNVRPALMTLRQMGFTHLRVLWLPKDFHTDWIDKGFPVEKGR